MIRWHDECCYCAEPATHDAELIDLFGDLHTVPVCVECARLLEEADRQASAGDVA